MTDQEKIDNAIDLIQSYGTIDGGHHKMWVLDQVLRLLMGEEDYGKWIDGEEVAGYSWDEGIAP